MKRLDGLTGLRWYAAFGVFAYHVSYWFLSVPGAEGVRTVFDGMGALGVSFFFVLSGFVLTWAHQPTTSASTFYRRRIARIVPLCWLTTVLAYTVEAAFNPATRWGCSPGRSATSPFSRRGCHRDASTSEATRSNGASRSRCCSTSCSRC
ncbi:acyltransferase family protein [Demequina mangrovi]|uniref:acyltransferase family protein n=1 Tax=Demequina mangrovi TaxID=1043493 RepID=UPI00069455AC|nr:acyltransferase [Demequina mangrovi]